MSKGFALAREWIIGLILAFIIPFTIYYGIEVYYTYVKHMPYPEINYENRETRNKLVNKTLFYTALIVGLGAIIVGNFLLSNYLALTIGLSLGGLFTLIMGYGIYWNNFGLLIKFSSLIAAVILLLFIAIKHLRREP